MCSSRVTSPWILCWQTFACSSRRLLFCGHNVDDIVPLQVTHLYLRISRLIPLQARSLWPLQSLHPWAQVCEFPGSELWAVIIFHFTSYSHIALQVVVTVYVPTSNTRALLLLHTLTVRGTDFELLPFWCEWTDVTMLLSFSLSWKQISETILPCLSASLISFFLLLSFVASLFLFFISSKLEVKNYVSTF